MKTDLARHIDAKGISRLKASKMCGVGYTTFYRHYDGSQRISAEIAIIYERFLGIKKEILRPDLWQ